VLRVAYTVASSHNILREKDHVTGVFCIPISFPKIDHVFTDTFQYD
jgi:hypothetical protein